MFELIFSDIGEGISEGKIIKFFFQEGDEVEEGVDLLEVETDKVSVSISSPGKGKIKKIFFQEGDQIKVGDLLLTIE